jgi:hypothetical protein
MKNLTSPVCCCLRFFAILTTLFGAWLPGAVADPVAVRYAQGAFHGFLELRSPDGQVVASGDATCVPHGDRLTAETVFHFKDGSVDDEVAVFTQRRAFQLISDHHIQKGPAFPHPMDVTIDVRSGTVTVRTPDKDGKEEVKIDHMKLPADLANGIVPQLIENLPIENLRPDAAESSFSMVVMTPKPRVVKLVVTKVGEDSASVVGAPRKATHDEIKIDLGGIVGLVAPLIGKAPPNIQMWIIGGNAPTFAREIGPLYAEGPMMTIQLASPVWGDSAKGE